MKYYTLINTISLSRREDKHRIQFPLFIREVCCFPYYLMRQRGQSHVQQMPFHCVQQLQQNLTICQHLHKYLCALKRTLVSLNSRKGLSASCSVLSLQKTLCDEPAVITH